MLFSENETTLVYVNRVINRFIKNDKFIDKLSNLEIGDKVYKFKEFEYTYGYSELFGYYVVAINNLKEGFLWIMPPNFNENENGLFFGTKEFKYLERDFYNVFNYTNFREIYLRYIRTGNINNDINSFLSVVMFRSFPWLKRFTKRISSKIILVYLFSKIYDFSNETSELRNELTRFNEEQTDLFRDKANIIKSGTFTANNIDKILKKEISFVDIIETIY